MTKLTLLGAAAILATALATPAMSQEATQEPGMIGFNYPNSDYLRGGYGVRTPSRHDYSYYYGGYGPRAYYGPGPGWGCGRHRGRNGGRHRGRAVLMIPTAITRGPAIDRAERATSNEAAARPLFCWLRAQRAASAWRGSLAAGSGLAWRRARMVRLHHPMS